MSLPKAVSGTDTQRHFCFDHGFEAGRAFAPPVTSERRERPTELKETHIAAIFGEMPFPIAHPAAVLPLRRYCTRWLSFPALVIGSVVPDVGYLLGEDWINFSHQLSGSVPFDLPLGILILAVFYRFRTVVAGMLSAPYQRLLLPLCRRPKG